MDCKICELKQRQFYCETCLKTHLHDFRQQTQHYALDRDDHVAKAARALGETITPARLSRAGVSTCQRRVEELQSGLAKLRKENEKKRDRLRTLRETLASRRRTISAATLQTNLSASYMHSPTPGTAPSPSREAEGLSNLSSTIARARSGLVQELVEVFNIVEVGGRPPIGGKAGTKGEWTIGDLILPVPGDMRRYPPDHINAVLTHTIHFLSLLTFYLGIKLPFEVVWTGGKLGVGQAWIGATKGAEGGGWARWYTKHPIHLSSAAAHPTPPTAISASPRVSRSQTTPLSTSNKTKDHLAASVLAADPPESSPQASFTTALSMLLYDVSYLASTQNIDVPLSQAGDVLSNLWTVCCSSELGRRSHETYPNLPAPTPASFPLDFSQLLQATVAHPPSRPRTQRSSNKIGGAGGLPRDKIDDTIGEEEEDGWDIVDDDV
ncbi:UV radiation resistance protein/autophagy-related protein 14 [Crassisporium funariophilum]|nr:UV radiation resistance protein/autophagy-related protein 14 [Crassisporium funariophilum]